MNIYKFLTPDGLFLNFYSDLIPFSKTLTLADKHRLILKIGYVVTPANVVNLSYTDKWYTLTDIRYGQDLRPVMIKIKNTALDLESIYTESTGLYDNYLYGWVRLSDIPDNMIPKYHPSSLTMTPRCGMPCENDADILKYRLWHIHFVNQVDE